MNIEEQKIVSPDFLPGLLGSFAKPAAENPTVAIMEAAFCHHQLHYRYINCEVGSENLHAAVEGAKAMGWRGFNCSIPNKVEVMKYLDRIGESAQIIGAVNTVVIGPDGGTTGMEFKRVEQPKIVENEDDFYKSAFNLLLDYTLYIISTKDCNWVINNKSLLHDFLTEYATSSAKERLERLDYYGVIPNQNNELHIKKELYRNVNIDIRLADIYKQVMETDLHDKWVSTDFSAIFTYNEQKASEVANEIQNKLSDGDFQDAIVLDIIELAENENTDSWKILFKTIYNQRESIRYKLGTPEERKAINRMMKKKSPKLLNLMADIVERSDAEELLSNVNTVISQMEHEAYIQMLGAYVEKHIGLYLEEAFKGMEVTVSNNQCGQDFILSKNGCKDYHIEVKSRWESDQSVEMSATQFKCAVENSDCYALINVNMCHFDRKRAEENDPLPFSEICSNIKVLDNIGKLEADLYRRADEAFRDDQTEICLNGTYKVRVSQNVFDKYPLDFNGLISRIRLHFCQEGK